MMHLLESGEMYLENILILREKQGLVRAIDIVNYTGYSKPSISRAVGLLKKDGFIEVDEAGYITLKPAGEEIAEKILERHRLLTDFLIQIGVSPVTAARDACKIEHDICDETFEKMKEHAKRGEKRIEK